MDEELKKGLRRLAKGTETKLAKSLLLWKYRKEGKTTPEDEEVETRSREIAEQAHEILSKRGKSVWNEFKKAYSGRTKKEESEP